MSSLRPLATIALLAAVGVFLYMKINESEPKLSPELEEWSTSTLDIGESETVAVQSSPGASMPAPTTSGGEAPPFVSAQLTPRSAPADPAPTTGDAPAWTPEPAAGAVPPLEIVQPESMSDSSPVARSADSTPTPDVPPLPAGAADPPGTTELVPSTAAARDANAAESSADDADLIEQAATTPTPDAAETPKPSMFAAARVAAQGALDRGELAQALSILSEWYGDPSLTPEESKEVDELLSQLAGSVIYEGPPAHRLAAPHIVQVGETLPSIAAKYEVPWQLLGKINAVADPNGLVPGQELKVVPGPFSALIDLSERKLTLMLDRRYAGQFALEIDPIATIHEGEWKVDQKLLTPPSGGMYGTPEGQTEDRSLLLANLADPTGQPTILRGPGNPDPLSTTSRGRMLRMKAADVADVYDILSEGSRVTIRR